MFFHPDSHTASHSGTIEPCILIVRGSAMLDGGRTVICLLIGYEIRESNYFEEMN